MGLELVGSAGSVPAYIDGARVRVGLNRVRGGNDIFRHQGKSFCLHPLHPCSTVSPQVGSLSAILVHVVHVRQARARARAS